MTTACSTATVEALVVFGMFVALLTFAAFIVWAGRPRR